MNLSQPNQLSTLMDAYCLCARAEGKSPRTIEIVCQSVRGLERFLAAQPHLTTDATQLTVDHIRAYMVYLRDRPAFEPHPHNPTLKRGVSDYTYHTYLRTLKGFFSWLIAEEILENSPFDRIRVPREPIKVIPTFSRDQLNQLLSKINTATPTGFRDHTLILTLLDTMIQVSELTDMRLDDVYFDEGMIKVRGKGNKERLVPMGKIVSKQLWRYITKFRGKSSVDVVFLTNGGLPFRRGSVKQMIQRHAERAGVSGVRCSPHTMRHTAAVNYLRNGGDIFSLQRILGHSTLEMTRRYCQLTAIDVKNIHAKVSPVDNMRLKGQPLVSGKTRQTHRYSGHEGHIPRKVPRSRT